MKLQTYKELIVWQRSIELVREIYKIAKSLPNHEQFILSSQMVRTAISIPANIAEGWGRNHKVEFIRFLNIAYGSSTELETHLIITKSEYKKVHSTLAENLNLEVQKMLTVLITKMKQSPNKW